MQGNQIAYMTSSNYSLKTGNQNKKQKPDVHTQSVHSVGTKITLHFSRLSVCLSALIVCVCVLGDVIVLLCHYIVEATGNLQGQ